MSKLTQTPPLISLNQGLIGPLQVHVHEPFLHRQGSKKTRAAVHLLDLLGRLELVLTKLRHVLTWQTDQGQKLKKELEREIESLKTMIESTWQQLETEQQDVYMQEMRLNALYPFSMQHLKSTPTQQKAQSSMVGANIYTHYFQMALYDQLYVTAARLYHSLSLPDHHYIPYQLVLAFQCINQLDMNYTVYRDWIKKNFDEIRSTISKEGGDGRLTDEQVAWLRKLMEDLMVQVLFGIKNGDAANSNRFTLLADAMLQTRKMSENPASPS
ncbi:hypothetical protein BJV82DRAFT_665064 [Fennellomyces sp. T-0311]|nr:hypothetical protein BJV82DRAFT_665064 [Fennellomyces sp. T-0311]